MMERDKSLVTNVYPVTKRASKHAAWCSSKSLDLYV